MTVHINDIESVNPLTNTDEAQLINNGGDINIPIATIIENIDTDSHIIVINDAEQYVYSITLNNYLQNSQNFDENTRIWLKVNLYLITISIILPFIIVDFYSACHNKSNIYLIFVYLVVSGYINVGILTILFILWYYLDINTLKININVHINIIIHILDLFVIIWSIFGLVISISILTSNSLNLCIAYIMITSFTKLAFIFYYSITKLKNDRHNQHNVLHTVQLRDNLLIN